MLDRAAELRFVYDRLRLQLEAAEGSGAAAVAREMRLTAAELEELEAPEEASKVVEMAVRRRSGAGVARPAARRRKSG